MKNLCQFEIWRKSIGILLLLLSINSLETIAAVNTPPESRISINLTNATVEKVLSTIEEKSEFYFLYSNKLIDVNRTVTINAVDKPINEILGKLFKNTEVTFQIVDRKIIVTPKDDSNLKPQVTIKGTVKDDTGEIAPGVTVQIKGTGDGTITGINGEFSLSNIEAGTVLVFSFIGMKTQEVIIQNQTTLSVVMENEAIGMDEVVVVGYSSVKKANLTGAVSTVKMKEVSKQANMQVSQSLVGASPGVTVIESSGQPGGDQATIRIRGLGSMSASMNPLVIIDGVEGDLNGIDPNDIESISILKDAGSAAIYGSRGANGVILVTTKRAKSGKVTSTFNAYYGMQQPTNVTEYANAVEYLGAIGDFAYLDLYRQNPNDKDNYPDVNWLDELFSTGKGVMNYQNYAVQGGSDAAKIRFSFSHQKQEGNIINFAHERFQARVNMDFKLNEKIKFSSDIGYRFTKNDGAVSGANSIVANVHKNNATDPFRYSDGRYGKGAVNSNWVANAMFAGVSESTGKQLNGNLD